MSDTTTITAEERARLHSVLSEHGTPQVEDRIILRLLNTIEQAEARALTWTTEPPKVAGWYWWRTSKGQNVNTIQIWSRSGVLGYCFDTEFITDLNRGEWAGPISPPID